MSFLRNVSFLRHFKFHYSLILVAKYVKQCDHFITTWAHEENSSIKIFKCVRGIGTGWSPPTDELRWIRLKERVLNPKSPPTWWMGGVRKELIKTLSALDWHYSPPPKQSPPHTLFITPKKRQNSPETARNPHMVNWQRNKSNRLQPTSMTDFKLDCLLP